MANGQDRFYRSGVKFFEHELYRDALKEFSKDKNAHKNRDLILKRMISLYETNELNAAKRDIASLLSFKKKEDELFLYLGKIYHAELNFEKAIEYYKEYLRRTNEKDKNRPFVISEIKRCATGLSLQYFDQKAFVENMGPEINSVYDEIDPIQSPNYLSKYYFSSNRPSAAGGLRNEKGIKDNVYGTHFLDMFSASLENGKWSPIQPLNSLLNTSRHERVLDFSSDGSVLFFLKGDSPTSATIYVDTFGVDHDNIYPPKFESPLIGEKGDVYLQFYNDSTIIFSSKRKGGYGGYDIYVCYKSNNYWSSPRNLGPAVNGPLDEVSPFLTKDGMTLFYSSNGVKSIGGFDVFKSTFSFEGGGWSVGENMNIGINSTLDDMYFRISADGQSAYFSSSRKNGMGKFDLYKAYLKQQELGQLAYSPTLPFIANDNVVKDIVKDKKIGLNDESSKAASNKNSAEKIKEYILEPLFFTKDENLLTISNLKTLENVVDIMKIYPDTKIEIESHSVPESQIAYELYFSIKRAEKIMDYLKVNGIDESRVLMRGLGSNYPLVSTEKGVQAGKLAEKLNRRLEIRIKNIDDLNLSISYNDPVVAEFLKDISGELYRTIQNGLTYKVFIAKVSQMYQNEILNHYQDAIIERDYGSKDYVYTIGIYKDYFDAQAVLKSLKEDNIEEAKIIPFIDGKRMNPSELMNYAQKFPDLVNYLQYNGQ